MKKTNRAKAKLPPVDPRQLGFAESLLLQARDKEKLLAKTSAELRQRFSPELQSSMIALERQINDLYHAIGALSGSKPRRLAS